MKYRVHLKYIKPSGIDSHSKWAWDDTVEHVYKEIENVSNVLIEGVFVRFQEDKVQNGLWVGTEDIAVYNRDNVVGWERVE